MKANDKSKSAFLSGGGEMGALIRSFDWSTTSIGSPDTWPQTLRIAISIMLDSPFGMYIAWSNEYIQLYNDGYRPILGSTKHPEALGSSTRKTFAEIWTTIGPMFEGVMQGTPVGFPDFTLNLDRNGYLEECVFDFSYSPIRLENGEVGGVLVTVIETTEKVKAANALKESEQELQFAIDATELGTWDLNPATNKFRGNNRLKEWFGLQPDEEIELPHALAVIADKDKEKVTAAIQKALQFSSGGKYNITYTIIHPQSKNEKIVRAKGKASFNEEGIAYRFNGTLQDVTEEILARRLLKESELQLRNERMVLYNSFMDAPAGIAILHSDSLIYEFFNTEYEKLVGRNITIGKTVHDHFPEIEQQGLIDILKNIFITGEPFIANEFPVELLNKSTGKMVLGYYNTVVQPIKDENGNTERLLSHAVEVTQQVEARKQIEVSEQRFRTLSETIPHMIWTAEPNGKRNFFNKYVLDFTGKTIEELYGDGWQKMISPLDITRTLKQWNHCIKTGEDFKIENRWVHHDGTSHWFLTLAIAQKDTHGNIISWVGTNTNIGEQKKFAQELEVKVKERTYQLHIQNETFKQAEESSKQGSYSFNLTTGKLSYSDNLYRLIGFLPNEFEPSLEEFNEHVHQDDREFVQKAAEKVVESKTANDWHYRMITKTGKIINIKGTGRIIDSGDETLLVGTLQDVTKEFELNKELKEKEEYSKRIINNAPDAVIVINEESKITIWNPRTEEIFGWKAEEVLGLNLSEIIVPIQHRHAHQEGMKRFLSTGEAHILNKTLELSALNKAGKEFPISITISQAKQQGNKLFIAFIRDITIEKQNKEELIFKSMQLKEMNQSLELKNKELENTNAELASFSYVASHDLQEPLRKIQTFGKRILETEKFSSTTQDYFNRIISASERMQNLIISLLDFSRTNTTELNLEPCDLNTIVEESKNDLHLSILAKQTTIEYENLPTINGIHVQLIQLFTNLIDNAIKYSRTDTKPHIKISAAIIHGSETGHLAVIKQREYYAIKIEDNGIGFEKQYETKIFELFQRLHHRDEYSGTGIGLAIVKKIVANHNGFIIAEGKPNVGSTFTIYFPTS